MDLTMPMPKLAVQTATARGSPCEAKTVQHVPKQIGKARMVQPVTTELSISSKGGVGVVVHLLKQRRNMLTFHPSETTTKLNISLNNKKFHSDF
jgi:hypothetical protein